MYKVFLADDEIVVREGIRNSIPWKDTPYTLAGEAPDGEMALAMIREIKPDILITDIRMPFMDGLALSREVKKAFPWIKIIILSGHDEFEYAREAISIGVEEYLLKPVSAKEMRNCLDKIAKRIGGGLLEPAGFSGFDGDIFFTRLKYAAKKDIDSIVSDCAAIQKNSRGENTITAYFLFGEIVMAASRIVESSGGNFADIVPFSLSHENIQEIISSSAAFAEKTGALLDAVIEYRNSHTAGRYQSVIVKAREYIDRNFADPDLSLYSTAAYVGISPNHLSAVFARETEENFIEYLTRVRIERAKHLLKSTGMKGTQIAAETGFSDPHYFSHIFRKHTGFSPREFRRNYPES